MDPEIKAMSEISGALDGLDSDAIARVLRWAADRYTVSISPLDGDVGEQVDSTQNEDTNGQEYEVFADFFDATDPSTGLDKVLVAAYWKQEIEGNGEFDSRSINRELKHLGHPSSNITRDLDSLMKKSPRLIIQTRKTGKTKQATKRYKVTAEGIKIIKAMIDGTES